MDLVMAKVTCQNVVQFLGQLIRYTLSYYGCFFYFLLGRGRRLPFEKLKVSASSSSCASTVPSYNNCPYFQPELEDTEETLLFKKYARIHMYSLALLFYLWDKPHYRKASYREDKRDNLRNVAIPGTGCPLSIFTHNKATALLLLLVIYPLVSIVAAVHGYYYNTQRKNVQQHTPTTPASQEQQQVDLGGIAREYATRLLAPDDWFSYWRLNCRIAAFHALLNNVPAGYAMENKWLFLQKGVELGVPVSPCLSLPSIVVKHRNEEGGMGIFFYKNATVGGDWIIQEKIHNSPWVSSMLPPNSPLSTFRVITISRASLDLSQPPRGVQDITALSCVFRAGREGAATDHDSILFDINPKTGELLKGTTNAHWYRLGVLKEIFRCPWRSNHETTHHPDGNIPVTGNTFQNIKEVLHLVEESHLKMCPDVPLAGWDVVLSADPALPVCLLEVNLSCNFFRGTFDRSTYLDFIEDCLVKLHDMRLQLAQIRDDDKKWK
jgi:hypothetical protein